MNRRDVIAGAAAALCFPWQANAEAEKKKKQKGCPCVDQDKRAKHPLQKKHAQICAFHLGVDDPKFQIETTHYCTAVGDGVFQCILYESSAKDAKLLGVEYVVTDEVYQTLSVEEKKLWHPHNYEIMEGLLTIHNVAKDCEEKLLKALVNSWGKSWHTWPDPTTKVPLGKPILMWSADAQNKVKPELVQKRDKTYNLKVEEVKKDRSKLLGK